MTTIFARVVQRQTDDIGRLLAVGYSWEVVYKEILKCEVRCSNCHRKKTARERGTLRWRFCARFSMDESQHDKLE